MQQSAGSATVEVRGAVCPPGPSARSGKPRVVLVTPEPGLRGAAARALGLAGFDVIPAAHSGHATLASLTAGSIDVLVADLAMDDLSGPALAERLRRDHPALRTVYFAEPGASECEGVLVRPFTRDELVATLRGALTSPPA